MAEFDLNLSTQPFPAYRLVNIAIAAAFVVLAVLSVWQASGFVKYSNLARSIRTQEQESRVEATALGKRVAELESHLDRPESAAKLNEIGFLNHLILRKDFSWTKLIAVLEDLVPENVHLTNLTPKLEDGNVTLRLGVRAKSIADVTVFLKKMEESPLFGKVGLTVEERKDQATGTGGATIAPAPREQGGSPSDIDFTLSVLYYPQKDGQ
jgi:Fimbrial assembly protein (PilN)